MAALHPSSACFSSHSASSCASPCPRRLVQEQRPEIVLALLGIHGRIAKARFDVGLLCAEPRHQLLDALDSRFQAFSRPPVKGVATPDPIGGSGRFMRWSGASRLRLPFQERVAIVVQVAVEGLHRPVGNDEKLIGGGA
jgi:hypothetical protein